MDGRAQEGPARAVSSPGATQNPYMTGESQEHSLWGQSCRLGQEAGTIDLFPTWVSSIRIQHPQNWRKNTSQGKPFTQGAAGQDLTWFEGEKGVKR